MLLLESDLLDRGYMVSAGLREGLVGLSDGDLVIVGSRLLADLDALLGAARPHVPLFRNFPLSVPDSTDLFFVDRVLTLLLQHPDQPCVLCGTIDSVHPVSPCAHLVCRTCFDGSDFSACPICHRRIDLGDPFLRPGDAKTGRWFRRDRVGTAPRPSNCERLTVLQLGSDLTAAARDEVTILLGRPTAPRPTERDELRILLTSCPTDDLGWLPERIPARESKAALLAWLVGNSQPGPDVADVLRRYIDTATDVLRLLATRSGGDGGLLAVPRFTAVSRPLRRLLLGILDELEPDLLLDDMRRHQRLWISAAERLHPFEFTRRYPRAAAAFAVLRGTDVSRPDFTALAAAAGPNVTLVDNRLVLRSWRSRVEAALTGPDLGDAIALLDERPGEFLRRLSHLLHLAEGNDDGGDTRSVLDALPRAAKQVSPAVLLATLGAVRVQDHVLHRRVFFPAATTPRAHLAEDHRRPLSPSTVGAVTTVLTREVLRRTGQLPSADVAVIDEALFEVTVPFTERTASRSLVSLPRGSAIALPAGQRLRLFLHWMQSDGGPRVDLDLSLAMFDEEWTHVGTCDYTNLRFAKTAAVHSGDLTSAPPPLGASEFVDLDLRQLAEHGVHRLVIVVFSYNNVAFENMREAFVGSMALGRDRADRGSPFVAPAVEQRLDLSGDARAMAVGTVDLVARNLRWLDLAPRVTGTDHAVHWHHSHLSALGRAVEELVAGGARVSVGELAVWHAAGRAGTVFLRSVDGLHRFSRRLGEPEEDFARRLFGRTDSDGAAAPSDAGEAMMQVLLTADLPSPCGATVHAIFPGDSDPERVSLRSMADLAAALGPG